MEQILFSLCCGRYNSAYRSDCKEPREETAFSEFCASQLLMCVALLPNNEAETHVCLIF